MYTFTGRLKIFSIALMIVGILGIGYGFLSVPNSTQEVEQLLKQEHEEHLAHGGSTAAHDAMSAADHQEHVYHVYHQLTNKPWSAIYVAALFFFMIAMGVLAFFAIQHASQAGWSPVLLRVMEGINAYVLPGGIIMFVLLLFSALHFNHMFVWMADGIADPTHENYDAIVANKTGYLNIPFFLIRAFIFIGGWILYSTLTRKYSYQQDLATSNESNILLHKKIVKASAAFLVFYIVTESVSSWDWIMSLDPHWYSTLFGWYVFSSSFVSGITVITLITIYLKSKGLLEFVNKSHLQDLAKFMFAISIFWGYLWFSQFMLIWYANIPEEVTYFIQRIDEYNLPFFGMLVLNLVLPLLILMSADHKKINWVVVFIGFIILFGHYLDFFNMVMPATVGARWFIGIAEIGSVMFFLGLFIYVVFNALSKRPLIAKNNPLIEESKQFHY